MENSQPFIVKSKTELVRLVNSPNLKVKSVEVLPLLNKDNLTILKKLKESNKVSVLIITEN